MGLRTAPACYTVAMPLAADTIDTPQQQPVPRLRDGLAYPLVVFVALRVLISIAGIVFVGNHPPNPSAVGPGAPPVRFTQPATNGLHNAREW